MSDQEREPKQTGEPGSSGSDPTEQAGGPGTPGVYPASAKNAPDDATAQGMASFGQGKRGAEGYDDHGESAIEMPPGDDLRDRHTRQA